MECYNSTQSLILFIVEIVSCIVTGVGIFIALWQTKYPYKKKIKFDIKKIKSIHQGSKRIKMDDSIYTYYFFNNGNVDISIDHCGIRDYKGKILIIFTNSTIDFEGKILGEGSVPSVLKVQSNFNIFYSLKLIIKHIEKNQITTKRNCKRLYLFLKDKEGKVYKKKINKRKFYEIYDAIKISELRENNSVLICEDKVKKRIQKLTVKWYDKDQGIGYGSSKKVEFDIFFKKEQLLKRTDDIFEGDEIDILID